MPRCTLHFRDGSRAGEAVPTRGHVKSRNAPEPDTNRSPYPRRRLSATGSEPLTGMENIEEVGPPNEAASDYVNLLQERR
jgi:hypothetical protein